VKWYAVDQQRDIDAFLDDMGCSAAKAVSAPMPYKHIGEEGDEILSEQEQKRFRSAVGSLQYFVSATQWHLAHAVSRLAQFNGRATKGIQKQLTHLMAWLAHNSGKEISGPVVKDTVWEVYSDSDHAGDRELGTRSHTGVVIMCNGAVVSWRSKKQPVAAASSAAAEIYAMAEAARDARLHCWQAEEMGLTPPKPIEIQVDNTSGVIFQTKMNPQSRLKGMIDLRWQWVKELQDAKLVKAVKVNTLLNVADLLTKCHSRISFNRLVGIVATAAERTADAHRINVRNATYMEK
jgi:hypothetical protein